MSWDANIRAAHQRLSAASAAFLDFAASREDMGQVSFFEDFFQRADWYKFKLQAWPTLVDSNMVAEMAACAESIDRLNKALFERYFKGDLDTISAFYQLDKENYIRPIMAPPNGIKNAISRLDCLLTRDGFKVLEVNSGSYIGGWQMAFLGDLFVEQPQFADFLKAHQLKPDWFKQDIRFFNHVIDTVIQQPNFANDRVNLGIIIANPDSPYAGLHNPSRYQELYAQVIADHPKVQSGQCEVIRVDEISLREDGLYGRDVRLDAVFEQHDKLTEVAVFQAFKQGAIQLFSGPVTTLLMDKMNLALISTLREGDLFSEEEREQIDRYIPWTRQVKPGKIQYKGADVELTELLPRERDNLVLKLVKGYGGQGVFVGRFTAAKEWEKACQTALEQGSWIVQEYIESEAQYYLDEEQGVVPHDLVWGLHVIGDAFSGGYLRMLPRGKGGIVNAVSGSSESIFLVCDAPSD